MSDLISVGIGIDALGWCNHFAVALEKKIADGFLGKYSFVNLDAHDWLSQIENFDIIIWKPHYMGIKSASHFKEKIYFLQYVAHKLVIPNFETIWHFESKVAQSYLFSHYKLKSPPTAVSFDYHDAHRLFEQARFPLVFKSSEGAASKNVRMETNRKLASTRLRSAFSLQLWAEAKKKFGPGIRVLIHNYWKQWAWDRIFQRVKMDPENVGVIYWQDFISDNTGDLRITVIGDKYAFGFWRNNRPNDFRASGSGLIDYLRPVPEKPLRYCLKLNKDMGFDSMCYDILFSGDDFVLTEMSYSYSDSAIYNTHGHYLLHEDDDLTYEERHVWPQELWVEWALQIINKKLRQ